mmetsp:Transcript_15755/g.40153  ORF Transcript_15755/g.40153 Transcript_15755/m.40153 type:complete len:363 (-) Transcript_15755:773-1861(-)
MCLGALCPASRKKALLAARAAAAVTTACAARLILRCACALPRRATRTVRAWISHLCWNSGLAARSAASVSARCAATPARAAADPPAHRSKARPRDAASANHAAIRTCTLAVLRLAESNGENSEGKGEGEDEEWRETSPSSPERSPSAPGLSAPRFPVPAGLAVGMAPSLLLAWVPVPPAAREEGSPSAAARKRFPPPAARERFPPAAPQFTPGGGRGRSAQAAAVALAPHVSRAPTPPRDKAARAPARSNFHSSTAPGTRGSTEEAGIAHWVARISPDVRAAVSAATLLSHSALRLWTVPERPRAATIECCLISTAASHSSLCLAASSHFTLRLVTAPAREGASRRARAAPRVSVSLNDMGE